MKRLLWAVPVTIVILGLGLGLGWAMAWQPRIANHFGYALPLSGASGLPFRLSYAGRHYANDHTCAGDDWCKAASPLTCSLASELRGEGYWPLQQVGSVLTLFGPSRPMLRAPTPGGMTTMALYVPIGKDCYLPYSLEGGP